MKYLIDTHTFLWAISAKDKLTQSARDLIEDPKNEIYLSTASLWEIAIKISIGKLRFNSAYEPFISQQLVINDFSILSASLKHYEAISALPMHHKDPFDRLIVAQSLVEEIAVISVDDKLDSYQIHRIW